MLIDSCIDTEVPSIYQYVGVLAYSCNGFIFEFSFVGVMLQGTFIYRMVA